MPRWYQDWDDSVDWIIVGMAIFVSIVVFVLAALIAVLVYFGVTGGYKTEHIEKRDGVTCYVTRDRLTGDVEEVACAEQR